MELSQCPWGRFDQGTVAFCERRLCAWIVEPSNTWSNLAYIAVGLYLLWIVRHRLKSAMAVPAYTSILVGIGSFAFHGTGTFWGEVLDVSAMYLISAMFITFNVKRYWDWPDNKLWALYAVICAVSIALLIKLRWIGIPMFVAHVTIAGLLEIALARRDRKYVRYKYLHLLVWFFVAAFTAWVLDIRGILCDPDNHIFTGHAFWHCANSLCLYFFYRYHEQFENGGGRAPRAA
jgi:hypothetical protein